MHVRRSLVARAGVATGLLLFSSVVAACGGSGNAGTASSSGNGADTAVAQERLAAAYEGNYSPPEPGTPTPEAGQTVWVIATDLAQSFSETFATKAEEAGDLIGWNVKVFDSKSDPNTALQGIRQAVAAKADGIVVEIWDCASLQAGLTEAKAAGIAIVADQGMDCTPPLFDAETFFKDGGYASNDGTTMAYLESILKPAVDWVTVKSGGAAKIITIEMTDVQAPVVQAEGVLAEIEEVCADCDVVGRVKFTAGQISQLQQMISQALLQHPEATAVINTVGDWVQTAGLAGAVQSSGRVEDLLVTGVEGAAPNMDLIRKGGQGQDVAVCSDNGWNAYADIDQLIRVFGGVAPSRNSGQGWVLVDKEHNLTDSGACTPMSHGKPFDYAAAYVKLWGK